MHITELHTKNKKKVSSELIQQIVTSASPTIATERLIDEYWPEQRKKTLVCCAETCATIDSLDSITAAFVVMTLRQMTREQRNPMATSILRYAEELKEAGHEIQGLKGLCHARDEAYRKTGVFLV